LIKEKRMNKSTAFMSVLVLCSFFLLAKTQVDDYPPGTPSSYIGQTTFTKYDTAQVIIWSYAYNLKPTPPPTPPPSNNTTPTPAPTPEPTPEPTPQPTPEPTPAPTPEPTPEGFNGTVAPPQNFTATPNTTTPFPPFVQGAVFWPLVDVFASCAIDGSYSTFMAYEKVLLQVQIGGVLSPMIIYRTGSTFGTSMGIGVTVDSGTITSLDWDTADCSICESESDHTCIQESDQSVCAATDGSGLSIGVYIFIGWTGTDSNGENLVTTSYLPSQFQQYSVQGVWNAASNLADTSFTGFNQP